MNKHKRVWSWKLLFASLVVGLIACVAPSLAWADVPNPSTYTYIRKAENKTLDPHNARDNYSLVILADIYQRLVQVSLEDPAELVGDAAESWSISEDGLTYTFRIRKGLVFHDGTQLTAHDVKYSMDRTVLMNGTAGIAGNYRQIKGAQEYINSEMTEGDAEEYLAADGITVLDDYTVSVHLTNPFAPFIKMLSLYSFIASAEYVDAHGGVVPGEENEWMSRNAMGSGPFKFVEWVPGQRVVLERFDDYWQGPASVERVVIEFVSEPLAQSLKLQTGEADVIELSVAQASQVLNLETGESLFPDIKVLSYPLLRVQAIFFNFAVEPFNDVRFREATSKAFPYDLYVEAVLYDTFGFKINGAIPKGMSAYPEDIPLPERDAAKAKALFEEVGWTGTLEFTIRSGRAAQKQMALMLKDAIEGLDVGITIEVKELASSTFVGKMRNGELAFWTNSWGAASNDADPMCEGLYYSNGYYPVQQSFSDELIDEWVIQARSELDQTKRNKLYHNIVERANKLYPHIIVHQDFELAVMGDWVQGWKSSPLKWDRRSYTIEKSYD